MTIGSPSRRTPLRTRRRSIRRGIPDLAFPALLLTILLGAKSVLAVEPMPSSMRIEARVQRTLSAPADQPMTMPTAVVVDHNGRILVADGVNNRIVCFRPDGTFDGSITSVGQAQLRNPIGLAVDSQNRLWIADTGKHRLVVAAPDASLVQTIDLPDSGAGHAADPTAVAVTPDGRRTYIVDNDNDRLLVRDNQTGLFVSLGSLGRALGQFEYPFSVCLGSDGYVFVCEAVGARIQTISPEDRWAGQISGWGIELGQLYRPKGIATDAHDRLFVSDSTLSVIQVFGPRGTIDGILTGPDGMPLRFEHPMGICFDQHGLLYIVELRANRVAVVSISQAPRSQSGAPNIRVQSQSTTPSSTATSLTTSPAMPSTSPTPAPTDRSRP